MAAQFPATSLNLLSRLKCGGEEVCWQVSWKRFLELYHEPIEMIARACYRSHTGGHEPSSGFIEDAVANTVADFFSRSQYRYDREKGRLRTYLRILANARVVDLLRKERPVNQRPLDDATATDLPAESAGESDAFARSLLASLVEDLRASIPLRQFEIFERVKLKHQSPQFVAEDLGIQRAMIDRNIHKAMTALRQLASHSEYRKSSTGKKTQTSNLKLQFQNFDLKPYGHTRPTQALRPLPGGGCPAYPHPRRRLPHGRSRRHKPRCPTDRGKGARATGNARSRITRPAPTTSFRALRTPGN